MSLMTGIIAAFLSTFNNEPQRPRRARANSIIYQLNHDVSAWIDAGGGGLPAPGGTLAPGPGGC